MDFSHIDQEGKVKMVDISGKALVKRTAVAAGSIRMKTETIAMISDRLLKKGDPIATARIAGIMAAKRTSDLIPLCHPLPIDNINIEFDIQEERIEIEATVVNAAKTGVEMEALTAVSVAALAIYDMCKAVDRDMIIGDIVLRSKKKEEL
ncbi:MAG: cyclic pyranopterin monophosphate synthase MoaC [Candidatus Krumholzibacteriota bacterium]|nr:cyclic pyranopterin monophosphate synthase MoaC [Candidatus Krumholzibacteriota bacterium]